MIQLTKMFTMGVGLMTTVGLSSRQFCLGSSTSTEDTPFSCAANNLWNQLDDSRLCPTASLDAPKPTHTASVSKIQIQKPGPGLDTHIQQLKQLPLPPFSKAGNEKQYEQVLNTTRLKFKNALKNAVAADRAAKPMTGAASAMLQQVDANTVKKAFFDSHIPSLAQCAVAFAVRQADLDLRKILGSYVSGKTSAIDQIARFQYLGGSQYQELVVKPAGYPYPGPAANVNYTPDDKPILSICTDSSRYDPSAPIHEMAHIYQDMRTLELIGTPEFRQMWQSNPALRNIDMRNAFMEGSVVYLTDKLTAGRHSLVSPQNYQQWGALVKAYCERFGEARLFEVLFDPDTRFSSDQDRLHRLGEVMSQMNKLFTPPR